jgi:hypothetical protein
MLISNTD